MPLHLLKMVTAHFDGMTLTLRGHAGAAPHGQDLVCAAVSALTYALAQRLTELEKEGALAQPPVIRLASGDAQISAIPKEAYAARVQEDFCLIQSGLSLLEHHYPNHIKVN